MKPFFVYMLRCRNGSYYVGHTDDLEKRLAEHVEGTYGGHTSRQRPVTFVWCAECDTRDDALAREWQIKKWSRAKKDALVREDWATLRDLARGPSRTERLRRFGVLPVRPERSAAAGRAESRGPGPGSTRSPFDSGPGRSTEGESENEPARPGPYAQGERESGRPDCTGSSSVRPEPFDSGASRLRSGQAESRGAGVAGVRIAPPRPNE